MQLLFVDFQVRTVPPMRPPQTAHPVMKLSSSFKAVEGEGMQLHALDPGQAELWIGCCGHGMPSMLS
ncbi:hypothetical protein LNV09_03290 [Paucibacter sp. B2R-40]|uniref:hypothetical protein n=1 Tax=Paucibacter sp. B2R-40 TaxID=2893554 RepID=UPI0021E50D0D|nr:hypothetical protein [Paucibacter sp. B2R-40]MCV2353180.1 hypothetical protein [Paucibacter sp. B2R-40]